MLGSHGDTDRRRRLHLLAEDEERGAQRLQRPSGQLVDGQLVGQPRQQDGELVPSHPGHGVLLPDGVDQTLAHLADEVVAGGVAHGVVDRLEVVEVHEEHAHRLTHAAGPDQLLLHPVLEEPPIGQAGERVVPRHVRDLLKQVQVLDRRAGLVGQARQPLVEVGVVDRGSGGERTEVGGDDAEELPCGEERGDHRRRRGRSVQQVAQEGIVGGRVEDHHLTAAHHAAR